MSRSPSACDERPDAGLLRLGQTFTGGAFVADVNGLGVIRGDKRETLAVWDRESTQWRLVNLAGRTICPPTIKSADELLLSIKGHEVHRGGHLVNFGYSSGEPYVWVDDEEGVAESTGHPRASWMSLASHGPSGPELWICRVGWVTKMAPLAHGRASALLPAERLS